MENESSRSHESVENRENRFPPVVSREQAAQLMGGEDELKKLLDSTPYKNMRELRKYPIGGTRLFVDFDENDEPVFTICTSRADLQGKDVDRLLKLLEKYKTPVTGSWEGFKDKEV
jgi:hypothetical protein